MNKKLFALLILFCSLVTFSSCGSDDNNNTGIDEEWKAYNERQIRDISNNPEYKERKSISGNGSVYWKDISKDKFFGEGIAAADPNTQTAIFTDSIAIRYEGSFLMNNGTPHIFDTTEGDNNSRVVRGRVSNFVDGFTTMLQYMRAGDQVDFYMPYQLGYGTTGKYNGYTLVIPGYTTLRFKLYLIDIIRDEK